jgi:hypothetical protein
MTRAQLALWRTTGVCVLCVLLSATAVKVLLNSFHVGPQEKPSWSSRDAKEHGVLICEVSPLPEAVTWKGKTIRFKEMWVEHRAELDHKLVWIGYYKKTSGYFLCFTLAERSDVSYLERPLFLFLLNDKRSFFGMHSTHSEEVFCHELNEYRTLSSARVYLTNSSEDLDGATAIKLQLED